MHLSSRQVVFFFIENDILNRCTWYGAQWQQVVFFPPCLFFNWEWHSQQVHVALHKDIRGTFAASSFFFSLSFFLWHKRCTRTFHIWQLSCTRDMIFFATGTHGTTKRPAGPSNSKFSITLFIRQEVFLRFFHHIWPVFCARDMIFSQQVHAALQEVPRGPVIANSK